MFFQIFATSTSPPPKTKQNQAYICDAIKQNDSELANVNLKIQPNKEDTVISLFSIVFAITQNAVAHAQEPIAQSSRGFHQIKA